MPTRPDPALLHALSARIRALEGLPPLGPGRAAVPVGAREVDSALPWKGLPRGCLHEVVAWDKGAAEGFSAVLLARLAAGRGPALWCLTREGLYGPGLGAFGLHPDRLIVVRARRADDVLWAMEEGLRCRRVGAVLGEMHAVTLTMSRRLQLAAEAGGVPALLLRPRGAEGAPGAAVTRWRVAAALSRASAGAPGAARWRVALLRCRGGVPRAWLMEWKDETGRLAVASLLADRAACPPALPPPVREAALSRVG
ncbi:MAG: ImuA family protein [Alphaproteobacteria bacterium]